MLGPLSPHPHSQLWLEIFGLATDGVNFVRGGGARGGGRRSGGGESPLLGVKPKKDKKEKSPSKSSKSAKDKKDKKEKGGTGNRLALMDAAVAPAAPDALETAAGGGGRWVHLPS